MICRKERIFKHKMSYTITFGDAAENHIGMEKIMKKGLRESLSISDLELIYDWFRMKGCDPEMYNITEYLPQIAKEKFDPEPATLLVVRGGIDRLLPKKNYFQLLKEEIVECEWDKKFLSNGYVMNKSARYNVCFADFSQKCDIQKGKGTVHNFKDKPRLQTVREALSKLVLDNDKLKGLVAEGNYYYDMKKCGIGFHTDKERRVVIGMRFGENNPLHFQWYYNGVKVGERLKIELGDGDIYFMSSKVVGYEKSDLIIKHAAGCGKFTQ